MTKSEALLLAQQVGLFDRATNLAGYEPGGEDEEDCDLDAPDYPPCSRAVLRRRGPRPASPVFGGTMIW